MGGQGARELHPFGQLLKHHLHRKALTQSMLAKAIMQEANVISDMNYGKRLKGAEARERIIDIIRWLHDNDALDTRSEADHLLGAAGMSPLGVGDAAKGEQQLSTELDASAPSPPLDRLPDVAINTGRETPVMVPRLPPHGVFGRDELLKEISELLVLADDRERDVPPVALRGLGGIGKTTLAIALGRQRIMPKLFPDGVLWVALGPKPTIRILLDNWGKPLNVDLLAERDETACQDRLRTILHSRRALLLVDDVWATTHGQYFNIGGPRCRTLFTTRESPIAHQLATRARTLVVEVLKPEASLALLQSLAPEAVNADKKHAERLCDRLEFLPLALTLAGRLLANEADVPHRMQWLLNELIEHRDARLKLIQEEGRLGLEDARPSLQAILGMSIERLSMPDQERFAMLSVFGGDPFTWEIKAAAHVWDCSINDAEQTVAQLVQRGLIEPRGPRYWMHALLADYGAEMMEAMGL